MFTFDKPGASEADTSSEPQVIDLNTFEYDTVSPEAPAARKSRSWFWPFGGNRSAEESIAASGPEAVATKGKQPKKINDSTNKVIAMRKVHDDGVELEDDFIDIQVRKLSYAEVAALQLRKDGELLPDSSRNASSGVSHIDPVVDQDLELEKSITDVEFADSYSKSKKFSIDEYGCRESAWTEEEQILEDFNKKLPKRFAKNGRYMKKRDTPAAK
ncbi:hypothetical protein KL910_005162 [Ogataea haglerorum]|nr:hypothetical protein KL947_005066 [Ogataea haglerorum]KAG7783781.1 hypothetical protein KL945_004915 [Ogataea haglerorum]KAG7784549.1 hypothetical protein KL910_005162 [Ogataea haglerorum]